ncbi:MAG: hypothetical protein U5R14_12575 [Gemmatimonadota bacterium]|nr:hypothetical protein [Gemmatimonadota bacterium]
MTDLAAKVAFLRRPESYPGNVPEVEAIETHMAWVFLAGDRAYKMKKPVRYRFLDFSTLEARRHDCEEEVRLNRRLSPDIYQGLVPLTSGLPGLSLGGDAEPVEWLVVMKRLPREGMLDRVITDQRVDTAEVEPAAELLAEFFARQPAEPMDPEAYVERLRQEVDENATEIPAHAFRLSSAVRRSADALRSFLDQEAELLGDRVRSGRVIEGHGDLRPEHVFLGPPPAAIDCLEFERRFRLLDPAQELAFLGLECERLGAPWIGRSFLEAYCSTARDFPPDRLVAFYAAHCGLLRAKIAIWHLEEDVPDPEHWVDKCSRYLDSATRHAHRALGR